MRRIALFGAVRLPPLPQSAGKSARGFRGEIKAMTENDAADGPPTPPMGVAETPVDGFAADPLRRDDATMRPHGSTARQRVVP